MPDEPYDGPGTYDYECDFVEAEMSKGRWSPSVPGWHTVWHRMVRRKYGYEAPTPEDNVSFGERARAVYKRYQRMKRKLKCAAQQPAQPDASPVTGAGNSSDIPARAG